MTDWTASITQTVIGLLGGGALISIVNNVFGRQKTKAEADSIAVTTANGLLTNLSLEVDRLHVRLHKVEVELQEAEDYVGRVSEALDVYRHRVSYLTALAVAAGLVVDPWVQPLIERPRRD